jgi:DNA-binding transcriptional LysR family regulator
MDMELRQLRYFVAAGEELHFSRAALRLHIAQPALSRQIQSLEEELGVALFRRDRRRVELTDPGRRFLDDARAILAKLDEAVVLTRSVERGEAGRLEIGHAPAADLALLPRLVSAFRSRAPDVQLVLRNLSGPDLHLAVREGRVQIGLLRLPIDDPALETITLIAERLVAVLPAGHRLAAEAEVSIRDLASEPIVLFPRHLGARYHDTITAFCANAGGFEMTPRQESDTIHSTLGLVAAGVGISLQPESIRTMPRTDVVYRTIRESPHCVETGIAFARGQQSLLVRRFIETAIDEMGGDLACLARIA